MSARFDLNRVRRAVIVAPHPDDETIGAFGLICRLIKQGAAVSVTVVTDGSASHPASASWSHARLKKARQGETRAALRLAGISHGAIRFLDYPDGQLSSLDGAALSSLSRRLASGPEPDLVVRPSDCDAHADHSTVAAACRAAWPHRVAQATYVVWPPHRRPCAAIRYPLGGHLSLKRSALRLYRTQTGLISDDPEGFRINPGLMRLFAGPAEFFGTS